MYNIKTTTTIKRHVHKIVIWEIKQSIKCNLRPRDLFILIQPKRYSWKWRHLNFILKNEMNLARRPQVRSGEGISNRGSGWRKKGAWDQTVCCEDIRVAQCGWSVGWGMRQKTIGCSPENRLQVHPQIHADPRTPVWPGTSYLNKSVFEWLSFSNQTSSLNPSI